MPLNRRARLVAVREFLDAHVSTRRWLVILTTVAAPALLVLLTYSDLLHLEKPAAFGAAFTLTVVAIVLGATLALTERSSGEVANQLSGALDELDEAHQQSVILKNELTHSHRFANQLASLATLRERFFVVINAALQAAHRGSVLNQEVTLSLLLTELAALAPFLLDLDQGERWSFAIYLLDEERDVLSCVGDVRPASIDNGRGHREWQVGFGMVGVCAFAARELVVEDAQTSDLQGIIRDPDDARAAEDPGIYRSVAGVPIFRPSDSDTEESDEPGHRSRPPLFGVAVATSDVPGRFAFADEDGLAPVRALADAVAMVLTASNFSRRSAVEGAPSDADSHDAPQPPPTGQ